jgi:hypothetical protein
MSDLIELLERSDSLRYPRDPEYAMAALQFLDEHFPAAPYSPREPESFEVRLVVCPRCEREFTYRFKKCGNPRFCINCVKDRRR